MARDESVRYLRLTGIRAAYGNADPKLRSDEGQIAWLLAELDKATKITEAFKAANRVLVHHKEKENELLRGDVARLNSEVDELHLERDAIRKNGSHLCSNGPDGSRWRPYGTLLCSMCPPKGGN